MYSGEARSSYRQHCRSGRGHLSHEVRMGTLVSTLRNSSSYVGDLNVLQIGDLSLPDPGRGHLGHVRSPSLKLTLLKCRCHLVIRLTSRI